MKVSLIAAKAKNGVIGCGPDIPWSAKGEQLLFKALTYNQWLLVGRKTFESMGALPNRKYAVVTRSGWTSNDDNVVVFQSIEEAMDRLAEFTGHVIVSGGGEIYRETLPIDMVVCHGDPCMPNFMVDPKTLQCTGLIDLGRLGTADRYADLALMIANAEENWAAPDEAERAFAVLFNVLGIEAPDRERLAFYLRLDPLTWG
ncbi:dihydrofolate reductase [Salmonella enterica]|nr:dihydrofolate reductase [Salmonella enterica]MBH5231046.1 dihydrofolate reductase [Salmonella enterica]